MRGPMKAECTSCKAVCKRADITLPSDGRRLRASEGWKRGCQSGSDAPGPDDGTCIT